MPDVAEVRVLVPGDEAELFAFLERHADSSLFLLSNAERAGLVDRGEPLQATYAARFDAAGLMTAVAGHSWNGNLLLQGDEGLEAAVEGAVAASGRGVRGIVGPWRLASRIRKALGLEQARAAHDGPELLYGVALTELKLPQLLEQPGVGLRVPEAREAGLLVTWRVDYEVEALGAVRSPELERVVQEQVERGRATGRLLVLSADAQLVAMTSFNAEARGIVQVGGVYTPPALRGRGYARAAVAASLQLARQRGAVRSILFTAETNHAARRAYASLGYQVIGDYAILLF